MQVIQKQDFDSRFDTSALYSILEKLPPLNKDIWLCAGAIRRTILNQEIEKGDLDFFFTSEQNLQSFKNCISNIEDEKDKELNISFKLNIYETKYQIQLIKMFHPNIESLLNEFDYTLCQTAFDGLNYYFGDFSLKDIVEKKIIVNKITYPISSFRRILKYSRQNFWMCPQQMEIFLTQVQNLGTLNNKVISVD